MFKTIGMNPVGLMVAVRGRSFRLEYPSIKQKKLNDCYIDELFLKSAATYSPTIRSTIGVGRLNFSVRNGKRWNPDAITTLISYKVFDVSKRKASETRIYFQLIYQTDSPQGEKVSGN